jgi:hypothetical protein
VLAFSVSQPCLPFSQLAPMPEHPLNIRKKEKRANEQCGLRDFWDYL